MMMNKTFQNTEVPALGFGTWQLEGRACRDAVADALAMGYRHIDTAQAYGNEEEVGQAIEHAGIPREELFVTTKIAVSNLAPARARAASEESLRQLRLDHVDLLLIHWPSEEVAPEPTLDVMMELQREGKVRHIGVSNFPVALLQRAIEHAPIFCDQVEYHPYLSQAPLIEECRRHDIMLTAYSPIAKGKIIDDEVLRDIGARYHKSTVQVALRWLLQQDVVTAIPKASSSKHRRANFDVFDFELTAEEMDAVSELERGHRLLDPAFAPDWDRH